MNVVSTQNIPEMYVDPDSIVKEELRDKLIESEDKINTSEGFHYQAYAGELIETEHRSTEEILDSLDETSLQYTLQSEENPYDRTSENFTFRVETAVETDFRQTFNEMHRKLDDKYGVDHWSLNGSVNYYCPPEENFETRREEFIEESSSMPLGLRTRIELDEDLNVQFGWLSDGNGDIEYGYFLSTGLKNKEFDQNTSRDELEGYLGNLDFRRHGKENHFTSEEVEKIMEFDQFLIEKEII